VGREAGSDGCAIDAQKEPDRKPESTLAACGAPAATVAQQPAVTRLREASMRKLQAFTQPVRGAQLGQARRRANHWRAAASGA